MSINMEEKNTEKEPLIRVENLKKYYPIRGGVITHTTGYVHSVDGVSFSIAEGETLGLVGESGCGKSVLCKSVMKLLPGNARISGKMLIDGKDIAPAELAGKSGKVFYQGKDMEKLSGKEKKSVRTQLQMVFQDPYSSLNPRKHIYEILSQPMLYHGISNKETVHRDVDRLLDMVGLPKHVLGRYPHEFSGGQRQRIGIARALSLNPRFLVCDEPVSALDVSIQAQILNLLMDLQEEKNLTYMFITHDMSVVKHISDDIAVMYLGQVVEKAEYQELFARPLHPYSQALFSAIPVPSIHNRQKRIVLKGEITSPVNPKPCCRFAARCPYATDLCREREPELRDMGNTHFVKCHRVEELNK